MDWNAIRAEYLGTDISQRRLAEKHAVSVDTLMRKANREKWTKQRTATYSKATEIVQQKTADAMADNAVIAARIKAKLLKQLEREIDALPENIGSETRKTVVDNKFGDSKDKKSAVYGQVVHSEEMSRSYKLRDLTAAYKDLTADMPKENTTDTVRIVIDV